MSICHQAMGILNKIENCVFKHFNFSILSIHLVITVHINKGRLRLVNILAKWPHVLMKRIVVYQQYYCKDRPSCMVF
jgi:hypothetical protein